MPIIILKNILLLAVAAVIIISKKSNPLAIIIIVWTVIALVQIVCFTWAFFKLINIFKIDFWKFDAKEYLSHYKLAYINFFIGIVAVLSLQADRLIVGMSFNSSITGIYFRHISLISILYQLFNIVSYNRLLPNVFLHAKTESFEFLKNIISKEYFRALAAVALGISCFMITYYFFAKTILDYFHIDLKSLLILLAIFSIRIYADYRAMILNALNLELKTLIFQGISLLVGILLMFILIPVFKVNGVLMSSFIATLIYALIMYQYKPSLN
jgi:O-antigen/teichoic acid export membrane protein